ncbi:hypothetical protein Dimus_013129, partial [Dionaea muscipula]
SEKIAEATVPEKVIVESDREDVLVAEDRENVRIEDEDPEIEILREVQGQPQKHGIGSRVSTRRRKSCRGHTQTVNTKPLVNEEEAQAKSGLEPELEENDSEDDPMMETPATEGQSSEDEILLRDMLSDTKM